MKKLFLLFVASVLAITGAKAEEPSTLVATLNHEGKMWAYYGKSALVDAYNFAREGDVITLSAGTFTVPNISKNVTVRGIGMYSDLPTSNSYTALEGDYKDITIQNNDSPMAFEGLCFLGYVKIPYNSAAKRITFTKVRFEGNHSEYNNPRKSISVFNQGVYAVFNDCIIYRSIEVYGGLLQNCLVEWLLNYKGNDPLTVNNCVIYDFSKYQTPSGSSIPRGSYINYANFTNTLLVGDGTLVPDWTTYSAKNCVGFSTAVDNGTFFNHADESNRMVEDREHFFKDTSAFTKSTDQYGDVNGYSLAWLGWYDLNGGHGLYELSDEAAKIYKGNDGTVVGVWGGAYPFNITPSNPRLTKCEIVPRVGNDGKLNVTIEVAQ